MISETTILALQSTAAVFMAADYFFNEKQRRRINITIKRTLSPVRRRANASAREHVEAAAQNAASLIVSVAFLLAGWLTVKFVLPAVGGASGPWLAALLALAALWLVAGGMPKIVTAIVAYLVPITIAKSFGLVLQFLIRCPKGSVFGIGFVFLVASFACRWYNIYP